MSKKIENQEICAVLCLQTNGGIGNNNDVLWRNKEIPGDMNRFKELTIGKIVIMGRKTWESLPENYRPLPDRINIVISNQKDYKLPEGVRLYNEPMKALYELKNEFPEKKFAVIGGAQIYEELFPVCDKIYTTEVDAEKPADTFVKIPEYFSPIISIEKVSPSGITYSFKEYENVI